MTLGHLFVVIAGSSWIAAGLVAMEVARLLGPTFHTTATPHWLLRGLAWLGAVILFARGVSLLFPGQLVEVSRMTVIAPLAGLTVLGFVLALLDWVMRDRAPPPWSVTALRLVALLGRDGPVKFAAMAAPPASVGDAPPITEPRRERRSRLSILIAATAVVALVVVFVAAMSSGGR